MDKRTSAKVASVVLFVHGSIELLAVMAPFAPREFLEFLPADFKEKLFFMVAISVISGLSRLVAGYAIWSMKKWGIVFGMAISIATMIGALSVYPFGVMDLPLAIVVLAFLLFTWFGGVTIDKKGN